MFVVYVLYSKQDYHFYIGQTAHLKQRLKLHKKGLVRSTKNRRPLELLCFEANLSRIEAVRREQYLKTNNARKELRIRLQYSLSRIGDVA